MPDINGRPYATKSQLKAGDTVEVDGGFTCMRAGRRQVHADKVSGELWVNCSHSGGKHYLGGQLNDADEYVGVYLVSAV